MNPEQEIVLRFRPLASRAPVASRVRALLKTALRRDALRCVRVEGLPEEPARQKETPQ